MVLETGNAAGLVYANSPASIGVLVRSLVLVGVGLLVWWEGVGLLAVVNFVVLVVVIFFTCFVVVDTVVGIVMIRGSGK